MDKIMKEIMEFIAKANVEQLQRLAISMAMSIPPEELQRILEIEKFLDDVNFDDNIENVLKESNSPEEFLEGLMKILGDAVFKYEHN
tara:strand:- start:1336 stop:1596 length:261 start_codon:yes stop_codon:yes gene_type:complete